MFILVFFGINVIQTWLIFSLKLLIKGGIIIGLIEVIELSLAVYFISQGWLVGFLVVVLTEIIQWSAIAYFSTKD